MTDYKGDTLAYRTDGELLDQFIEAFARHRDLDRVQQTFSSPAAFQGTVQAAQHLGLVDPQLIELSSTGNKYLLDSKHRSEILLDAIIRFEPYGLLLEAALSNGFGPEIPMSWISKWWGVYGYGASSNNREEAATTLAKLLQAAGLGTFMIGRRGRPSRIEWTTDAAARIRAFIQQPIDANLNNDASSRDDSGVTKDLLQDELSIDPRMPIASHEESNTEHDRQGVEYNNLTVTLGKGIAQVRLPARVTQKDKERFIKLMDLLIEVSDDEAPANREGSPEPAEV